MTAADGPPSDPAAPATAAGPSPRPARVEDPRLPAWVHRFFARVESVVDVVDAVWDMPAVRGISGWIAVLSVNIGVAVFVDQITGSVPWFPGVWQGASAGVVAIVCLLIFRAIYSPQAAKAEIARRRYQEAKREAREKGLPPPSRQTTDPGEIGDLTPHKVRAIVFGACAALMFSVYVGLWMKCIVHEPEWDPIGQDENGAVIYEELRLALPLVYPDAIEEYVANIRTKLDQRDAFYTAVSENEDWVRNTLLFDGREELAVTAMVFFWTQLLFASFATAAFAYMIAPEDYAMDVSGFDPIFA